VAEGAHARLGLDQDTVRQQVVQALFATSQLGHQIEVERPPATAATSSENRSASLNPASAHRF
jgi:hypothetical protein